MGITEIVRDSCQGQKRISYSESEIIILGVFEKPPGINTTAVVEHELKLIGIAKTLKAVTIPEEEIPALANQSMVLPDYKGNPRVATEDEMLELIKKAYYGI